MSTNYSDAKICVAGIGAIGTLMATMIGQKYSKNLCVLARNKRLDDIKKNGLILHSDFYGEKKAFPAKASDNGNDFGIQDYILICAKNYSLDSIVKSISPCVGEKTVIAPIMNGIEASTKLREIFPSSIVIDTVIYSSTKLNEDYSASQVGKFAHIFIGSKEKDEMHQNSAENFCSLLKSVGFDSRFSKSIESDIWQKFIHNCAFNSITARYLYNSGQLRKDEKCLKDLKSIYTEGYNVAKALGISMPEDYVEKKIIFTTTVQAESCTSSTKQDIDAGRKTEIDSLLGALIREADKVNVDVKTIKEYYKYFM